MSIIELLLKEMNNEANTTRKMLSRVPDDKFDWKPHPKSMSLKTLATHVAELPGWVDMTLNTSELDFAQNPYKPVELADGKELINYFEATLQRGQTELSKASEDQLKEMWTLRNGEQIFVSEPKLDMIRMSYSQIIHHRAQLGVYLRLLNIPVPGSYGPSADEN